MFSGNIYASEIYDSKDLPDQIKEAIKHTFEAKGIVESDVVFQQCLEIGGRLEISYEYADNENKTLTMVFQVALNLMSFDVEED